MHIYPNNTLAQYTINLNTPLVLGDSYEVGLCEIQYPHAWDNVCRGNNKFLISYQSPRREMGHNRQRGIAWLLRDYS